MELDCNEMLLKEKPTTFLNQWIQRSSTLQELIVQVEGLIVDPSFKRMDEKFITAYILENMSENLKEADLFNSIEQLVE